MTQPKRRIWLGAPLVAAAVAIIFIFATAWTRTAETTASVADQWTEAIDQYGLEAVYPPQEDVYVGDVFALISGDALSDSTKGALPKRAMKLWHINMDSDLKAEYEANYQFPDTMERPAEEGKIWTEGGSPDSLFSGNLLRRKLPLALLPELTIVVAKRASLGASPLEKVAASLGWGAADKRTIAFKLEGVDTYGVSAIRAEAALKTFCASKNAQWLCRDLAIRDQLSNIVGKEIYSLVVDPKKKEKHFRYSVDLAIVERVYTARRIESELDEARALTGNLSAAAQPRGGKREIEDSPAVDARISSSSNSAIAVKPTTFERPVVIAMRTIREWFDEHPEESSEGKRCRVEFLLAASLAIGACILLANFAQSQEQSGDSGGLCGCGADPLCLAGCQSIGGHPGSRVGNKGEGLTGRVIELRMPSPDPTLPIEKATPQSSNRP